MLASCDKEIAVKDAPDFQVTTASMTGKVGVPVTFDIKDGGVNVLSFYPGETLKEYEFRDGRMIDVKSDGATVEFSSSVQQGAQTNQLAVLLSTDFSGDYSSIAKVKSATWTDITSRFLFGTNTAFKATGAINISDLIVTGKPFYIAYKYLTKPQATNGLARQYFIQSFSVKSSKTLTSTAQVAPISLVLADQLAAGFRIIDEKAAAVVGPNFVPYDGAPAQASVSPTRVTLFGNRYLTASLPIFDQTNSIYDKDNPIYDRKSQAYIPTAVRPKFIAFDPASPLNDPQSEHWAVSKALSISSVDLGPDRPISIKGDITSSPLTEYKYTYKTPGTYKAVFVASNNSVDNLKQVVKEITLTITP